jgi:hypothetical protein
VKNRVQAAAYALNSGLGISNETSAYIGARSRSTA